MSVRPIVAAAATILLAASLAACLGTATPTGTESPTPTSTAPTTSPTAAPTTSATPSTTSTATPTGDVTIRTIGAGYDLPGIAAALRSQLPSWKPLTDDEVATRLNAGCDGIDATGSPIGGADAIKAYGMDPGDAAFGLLAAISAYCPEYTKFLGGS